MMNLAPKATAWLPSIIILAYFVGFSAVYSNPCLADDRDAGQYYVSIGAGAAISQKLSGNLVDLATGSGDGFGGDVGRAPLVELGVGLTLPWDFRADLTAGDREGFKLKSTEVDPTSGFTYQAVGASSKEWTVLANIYHDFRRDWGIGVEVVPYVGIGFGVSQNRFGTVNYSLNSLPTGSEGGVAHNDFAWRAAIGVAAKPADHWTVDFGYRYLDAGQFRTSGTVKDPFGGVTSGNVLSVRNNAAVDFALYSKLLSLAPMIVTIGNHDADIFDAAVFVQSLQKLGVTVITDIVDSRTDVRFAPSMTSFTVAGHQVNLPGFGTTALSTYSATWRSTFNVPDPGTWAAQNMASFQVGASLLIPVAHAGFVADQAIMKAISPNMPFIMLGAHDHLQFIQQVAPGRGVHLQTGAWAANVAVAKVWFGRFGPVINVSFVPIDTSTTGDAGLTTLIAQQKAQYLTSTDTQVLGTIAQSLDVNQAAIYGLGLVKNALGVDVAMCGNTTFGDGLHAGPVTNFDLSAFIRFVSYFTVANVDGATLANVVLPLTNQFGAFPYSKRTSGYLYTTPIVPVAGQTYKVAINTFSTSLSGLPAASFTPLPQSPAYELKAIVGSSLPH